MTNEISLVSWERHSSKVIIKVMSDQMCLSVRRLLKCGHRAVLLQLLIHVVFNALSHSGLIILRVTILWLLLYSWLGWFGCLRDLMWFALWWEPINWNIILLNLFRNRNSFIVIALNLFINRFVLTSGWCGVPWRELRFNHFLSRLSWFMLFYNCLIQNSPIVLLKGMFNRLKGLPSTTRWFRSSKRGFWGHVLLRQLRTYRLWNDWLDILFLYDDSIVLIATSNVYDDRVSLGLLFDDPIINGWTTLTDRAPTADWRASTWIIWFLLIPLFGFLCWTVGWEISNQRSDYRCYRIIFRDWIRGNSWSHILFSFACWWCPIVTYCSLFLVVYRLSFKILIMYFTILMRLKSSISRISPLSTDLININPCEISLVMRTRSTTGTSGLLPPPFWVHLLLGLLHELFRLSDWMLMSETRCDLVVPQPLKDGFGVLGLNNIRFLSESQREIRYSWRDVFGAQISLGGSSSDGSTVLYAASPSLALGHIFSFPLVVIKDLFRTVLTLSDIQSLLDLFWRSQLPEKNWLRGFTWRR
jgi:hypothetical protein